MIEITQIVYSNPIPTFFFLLVIVGGICKVANLIINRKQE